MFRNNVFKINVDTANWFKASLIRAVKTMAQTAVSMLTVGQLVTEVDWTSVLAVSATAGIISLLTSVAGIPEVEAKEGEE